MTKTFAELLSQRTVRDMYALAQRYDVPFNNRRPRDEIQRRLLTEFSARELLRRAFKRLNSQCRHCLRHLQTRGGRMNEAQFIAHFGAIRRYRPWADQQRPWKQPISIAEILWYGGFIGRDAGNIVLCAEVAALLPPLPAIHPVRSAEYTADDAGVTALLHDMASLLGTLQARQCLVTHERWLSPCTMRFINRHWRIPDPQVESARSELGTGRLRFLHYLAEVGALVAVTARRLHPSVAAWQWLQQSPSQQLHQLVTAVCADLASRNPLWDRYRFCRIERAQWDSITSLLTKLPAAQTYSLRPFCLLNRLVGTSASLMELENLFAGPLHWLGMVTMTLDRRWFCRPPNARMESSPAHLEETNESIILHLPALPRLHPLVELSSWADAKPHSIVITPDSVLRSGLSAVQIAEEITRIADRSLSSATFAQLQRWSHTDSQLQIENMTILTAADPSLLNHMLANRALRQHLGNRLNSHQVTVQPNEATTLIRKLARRQLLQKPVDYSPSSRLQERAMGGEGISAYAYLATRVYQELGDLVSVTTPLPGAISDDYKTTLADEQINALEYQISTIKDRLRAILQNSNGSECSQLPAIIAQDNAAAIRTAVEDAFAQRQRLHIEYFSPYQGVITQRQIEPLVEIRWQGEIGYVEAWCSLDNAPRTFRLDRILRILPQNGYGSST